MIFMSVYFEVLIVVSFFIGIVYFSFGSFFLFLLCWIIFFRWIDFVDIIVRFINFNFGRMFGVVNDMWLGWFIIDNRVK